MIGNIMNLVGIQSEPQLVIRGLVILLAVFLTSGGGVQRIRHGLGRLGSRRTASARTGIAGSGLGAPAVTAPTTTSSSAEPEPRPGARGTD
jgi:ribose transport system permease protein